MRVVPGDRSVAPKRKAQDQMRDNCDSPVGESKKGEIREAKDETEANPKGRPASKVPKGAKGHASHDAAEQPSPTSKQECCRDGIAQGPSDPLVWPSNLIVFERGMCPPSV